MSHISVEYIRARVGHIRRNVHRKERLYIVVKSTADVEPLAVLRGRAKENAK